MICWHILPFSRVSVGQPLSLTLRRCSQALKKANTVVLSACRIRLWQGCQLNKQDLGNYVLQEEKASSGSTHSSTYLLHNHKFMYKIKWCKVKQS